MYYTYTSRKDLTTIVHLDENEIKIKFVKNGKEDLEVYDYNSIKSIHLSVMEADWYGINLVFDDGVKVHLKSVTFEKSKFIGSKIITQSKDYVYWVLFLHNKISEKKLERAIKFTQGNTLLFIVLLLLLIAIVFVVVPIAYISRWNSIYFMVVIPGVIFLISYMYRLGFQKKYNPPHLPLKYLPIVLT